MLKIWMPVNNFGIFCSWSHFLTIFNPIELPPCSRDPCHHRWQERQSPRLLSLRRFSSPRQRFALHWGLFWHSGWWWIIWLFSELNHWLVIYISLCQLHKREFLHKRDLNWANSKPEHVSVQPPRATSFFCHWVSSFRVLQIWLVSLSEMRRRVC